MEKGKDTILKNGIIRKTLHISRFLKLFIPDHLSMKKNQGYECISFGK